mmetsp:Transcript_15914/g.62183  ORF Transcript_15914/g.62183 Transcript_15914/m.62183 type:complete len:368 (-) Transcript_15914:146-1249(-)
MQGQAGGGCKARPPAAQRQRCAGPCGGASGAIAVEEVLEEGVLQGSARRDALGGVQVQHAAQEVQALLVEAGHGLRPRAALPAREERVVVGQVLDALPDSVAGRAADLEDLVELVDLRVARKERVQQQQLGEDAADRPDVDRRRVGLHAEEDLRRAVPQRHHVVRVGTERHVEGTCQAKIGDLQGALLVDQEVRRLEVPVDDAARVAVRQAAKELVHVGLHQARRHWRSTGVEVALQIKVEELEHQEQPPLDVGNLLQQDDVGVVTADLLEEGDLAEGSGGEAVLVLVDADLLERAVLARLRVGGAVYDAVGALSDLREVCVLADAPRHARRLRLVAHAQRVHIRHSRGRARAHRLQQARAHAGPVQ